MIRHETIFFFCSHLIRFTRGRIRVVNVLKVVVRKEGRKRKMLTERKQQNNEIHPKQAADNKEANKDIYFWSNDEIQLLLMAALDFKSQCEFEGIDWESKRFKYE